MMLQFYVYVTKVNFVIYIVFIVSYKADGHLPIPWSQVEESILGGMLPSQVYEQLGHDFYIAFYINIRAAHYKYMRETYHFTDEQLERSNELNDSFVKW
jgi:hypothetical protein